MAQVIFLVQRLTSLSRCNATLDETSSNVLPASVSPSQNVALTFFLDPEPQNQALVHPFLAGLPSWGPGCEYLLMRCL